METHAWWIRHQGKPSLPLRDKMLFYGVTTNLPMLEVSSGWKSRTFILRGPHRPLLVKPQNTYMTHYAEFCNPQKYKRKNLCISNTFNILSKESRYKVLETASSSTHLKGNNWQSSFCSFIKLYKDCIQVRTHKDAELIPGVSKIKSKGVLLRHFMFRLQPGYKEPRV